MTTTGAPEHHLPLWIEDRRPRVAVGVDGSHWGRLALRWAAEHAWLAGAELEVHAPPDADLHETLCSFPLLPVLVRAEPDPVARLVAASTHADLVVLGCRGTDRPGIGLGAAVLPVAEAALSDVLVVGGRPESVRGVHKRISVLLGTGADAEADSAALRGAAALASLRRVPLDILHAVPVTGARPVRASLERRAGVLADAAATVRRRAPSVRTTTALVWANPLEVAAEPGATDVLVLGGHGPLDPVALAALHHANHPVLIARTP